MPEPPYLPRLRAFFVRFRWAFALPRVIFATCTRCCSGLMFSQRALPALELSTRSSSTGSRARANPPSLPSCAAAGFFFFMGPESTPGARLELTMPHYYHGGRIGARKKT